MKRTIFLLLLAVLFTLLSLGAVGCGKLDKDTKYYSIYSEDGHTFFKIKEGAPQYPDDVQISKWSQVFSPTIEAFYNAAVKGEIPDEMLPDIQATFLLDADGKVEITPLKEVYEPIMPDGWQCNEVGWDGNSYYCGFALADMYGSVVPYSKEEMVAERNTYTDTILDNPLVSVQEVIEHADRDATEYYFSTKKVANQKFDVYSINDGTAQVHEYYDLSDPNNVDPAPWIVMIFGSQNGKCFFIQLHNLPERPSVAFLETFGLKKYNGPTAGGD